MSDAGLVTAVVLCSASGLINILLGAVSAEYGAGAVLNLSQVALGFVSVVSAAIVSAAKQLQWEALAHLHVETAMHYAELARMIISERTMVRITDRGPDQKAASGARPVRGVCAGGPGVHRGHTRALGAIPSAFRRLTLTDVLFLWVITSPIHRHHELLHLQARRGPR
jgi:hypothetical protein